MHIPDGFLSPEVAAPAAVVSAAAVGIALRRAERDLDERAVPLLGVTGAFVFAAQMLNFPVAGGTSGHLLGATLAAALLGPWLACLVMAVVLTTQAVAFADGGLTALGANVLNMGIIGALLTGAAVSHLPRRRTAFLGGLAVVAWAAVMLGALATALELAASGTVPLLTALAPMLSVHALIGVGEAVITVAAVGAVLTSRADLVHAVHPQRATSGA
jgi:cobalt/nickel transport system permease protein